MSVQAATLKMLEAVNAIVSKARRLHNGIPETVVVLGASGVTRSGQKHGHYASRSWARRNAGDESGESSDGTREEYGEILLAGESLGRGAVATLGTILHELAHAYCDANEIKDTSNGNRYHNAKFRDVAEEFGLTIEKADTIGWSVTTVPPSTQEAYAAELEELEAQIIVHRRGGGGLGSAADPDKKKPKVRKMQCPECQVPLVVTKTWWEKQGNGGGDYEYGVGLYCGGHGAEQIEYELYEEGGE